MAKSKKDFTLLLIALFCSSLAHAQKQVPAERKDSIDNGSNIIKIVGNPDFVNAPPKLKMVF